MLPFVLAFSDRRDCRTSLADRAAMVSWAARLGWLQIENPPFSVPWVRSYTGYFERARDL